MTFYAEVTPVRRSSRQIVRELGFLDQHQHKVAMSHSETHALIEIGQSDGLSASDIADLLRLDKGSVSRTLATLSDKGWVRTRAAADDKRRKLLELTAKGRQKLAEVHAHANTHVNDALSLLSADERGIVAAGLQIYATALERLRLQNEVSQRPIQLQIAPYQERYKEQVIQLITGIQIGEFGVPVTIHDQPDLLDVPKYYHRGVGNFWVALDGNQVVGSIAMLDFGDGQVALRKMFVAKDYRGKNIGTAQLLLEHLLRWCHEKQVRDIYLGTVDVLVAAHRFYEKNGFDEISKSMLPANFPLMQVDTKFYHLAV